MAEFHPTSYRRDTLFLICPNEHVHGVETYAKDVPKICLMARCGGELVVYDARRKPKAESNTRTTD